QHVGENDPAARPYDHEGLSRRRERGRDHGGRVDGHPARAPGLPVRPAVPHRRGDAYGDQGMTGHPGLAREAPARGYWRRVGEDVAHELPALLGANALFLAWCAPAAVLL